MATFISLTEIDVGTSVTINMDHVVYMSPTVDRRATKLRTKLHEIGGVEKDWILVRIRSLTS